jgi:GNAT superfamily N-acetyltransferase
MTDIAVGTNDFSEFLPEVGLVDVPAITEELVDKFNESAGVVAEPTTGVLHRIKTAGQLAFVAAEVTPLNELVRLSVFGAGAGMSHNNPVVGAVTAGASTLVVEGFGALAAAGLLPTERSRKTIGWINAKLKKVGVGEDAKFSGISKAGFAFMGGSVVAMAIEQRENPDFTKQQSRRYGLRTAAWLSAVCGVGGYLAAEGIDVGLEHTATSLTVAAALGATALGRKGVRDFNTQRRVVHDLKKWRVDRDKHGLSYGIASSEDSLLRAATVEQTVWDEKNYGDLVEEGYMPYIKNSRTFAAFDEYGNCIGMNRMFTATETEVPPFLDMEFYDESEKAKIIDGARAGAVEELGTVAVVPEYRGKRVNLRLWRIAYRDARTRGVHSWGIIMEPERVARMNKYQGFTFEQMGPATEYQGGNCAPFIMSLPEVDAKMRKNHPLNYQWFVRNKLKR